MQPRPRSDVSGVTFTGSERINPPPDGGCRRGYCYACGGEIALLAKIMNKHPTLPRGDTFWFCSSFCYTRTLRAWVPFGYRYEPDDPDDETWAHMKDRERYFREAVPKLLTWLEDIESEEDGHEQRLAEEKRASYTYPDPPATWQPLYDPPVIRSIKRPSPARCIHCGRPEQSSQPVLVEDTPFWFCDGVCEHDAIKEFVPKRWLTGPPGDVEFENYLEALRERDMLPPYIWCPPEIHAQWEQYRLNAWEDAKDNLENRLRAEARKQEAEEAEKEDEVQQREWEKDYIAAEKEHEQFLEREAYDQALIFKPIPDHLRIHTGIIAKTGWGKTQLLQTLILWELKKPDPPSLIVLDSTGQMVDLIQRLAIFDNRLRDRILIIDPAHSPSLNMFDLSTPRFETYTREQKEDIQNEIVNLFNYVFSSEDYKLTGQMGIGFAYAVRLILSRPNSTIRDLRRLLEEDCRRCEQSAFASDIAELDEDAQDFFRSHFYSDEHWCPVDGEERSGKS